MYFHIIAITILTTVCFHYIQSQRKEERQYVRWTCGSVSDKYLALAVHRTARIKNCLPKGLRKNVSRNCKIAVHYPEEVINIHEEITKQYCLSQERCQFEENLGTSCICDRGNKTHKNMRTVQTVCFICSSFYGSQTENVMMKNRKPNTWTCGMFNADGYSLSTYHAGLNDRLIESSYVEAVPRNCIFLVYQPEETIIFDEEPINDYCQNREKFHFEENLGIASICDEHITTWGSQKVTKIIAYRCYSLLASMNASSPLHFQLKENADIFVDI